MISFMFTYLSSNDEASKTWAHNSGYRSKRVRKSHQYTSKLKKTASSWSCHFISNGGVKVVFSCLVYIILSIQMFIEKKTTTKHCDIWIIFIFSLCCLHIVLFQLNRHTQNGIYWYTLIIPLGRNLQTIILVHISKISYMYFNQIFNVNARELIITNEIYFVDFYGCINKVVFSLRVIYKHLYIDKIHKNEIHSTVTLQ